MVTRVEVSKGDVLNSGQLIAIVSGRPIFAVSTEFPLYRNLDLGDSGDDVRELNSLLSNLGKASARFEELYAVHSRMASPNCIPATTLKLRHPDRTKSRKHRLGVRRGEVRF